MANKEPMQRVNLPLVHTVKERKKRMVIDKTWLQSRLMVNKCNRMVPLQKEGE